MGSYTDVTPTGQHNDSRMNIALIMTAVQQGAIVANHVEVTSLDKAAPTGKLQGARVRDTLTGKEWDVKAKGIINATGPFSDSLLTMDNPAHKPIVQPSAGTHITLPNYYSPRTMGLLDPATSDELFEPGEDAEEGMDPSLMVGSAPALPSPRGTAMDEFGVVEVEEGTEDSGNVPTREDDEDGDCVTG